VRVDLEDGHADGGGDGRAPRAAEAQRRVVDDEQRGVYFSHEARDGLGRIAAEEE
jgi:hypothetical protein